MARYHDSWKTEIKTMFTPLPVDYMAQKLEAQQGEHDYYAGLIGGDLIEDFNPNVFPTEDVIKLRQNYQSDLQSLQEELDGTFDFNTVAQHIKQINKNYNIAGNSGSGVVSSNNNGAGSSTTSGGTNRVSSQNGYGTVFYDGSRGSINSINRQTVDDVRKGYNSLHGTNSDAYERYYVDRIMKEEYNRVSNSNDKIPQLINVQVVEDFDENKFEKDVLSLDYNSDGSASQKWGGDYTWIAKDEYIDFDRVYGTEVSGTLGYVLGNEEWNKHQKIMYWDGVNSTGTINPNQLASEGVLRTATNKKKQDFINKYGDRTNDNGQPLWEIAYQNYLNDNKDNLQASMQELQNEELDNMSNGIYNKSYSSLDTNQQKQILDKWTYDRGEEQYKLNKAHTIALKKAEQENFYKSDIKSLQQTPQSKYNYNKSLIDYEQAILNTNAVTVDNGQQLPTDKVQLKKDVTTLLNSPTKFNDQATQASTVKNNTINSTGNRLQGLSGNSATDKGNQATSNITDALGFSDNYNNFYYGLVDEGLILETENGQVEFKDVDNLELWQETTGNYNLTSTELKSIATDMNNASVSSYNTSQKANESELIAQTMTKTWLDSDDGQDWVDDSWNSIDKTNNKIEIINSDGNIQQITKNQFQQMLSDGEEIEIPNTDYSTVSGSIESFNNSTISKENNIIQLPFNQIAEDLVEGDYGVGFNIKTYTYANRNSQSFNGIVANENLYSKNDVFKRLTDVNDNFLTKKIDDSDIDLSQPYTVDVTFDPSSQIGDDGSVIVNYNVKGLRKGKKGKYTSYTKNFTASVNYNDLPDNGSGVSLRTSVLNSSAAQVNNLLQTTPVVNSFEDEQIVTQYEMMGTTTDRTQFKNLYRGGVDLIALRLQKAQAGDLTGCVYDPGNGYKAYIEADGQGNGYMVMIDENGDRFYNNFPRIQSADQVYPQNGKLYYNDKYEVNQYLVSKGDVDKYLQLQDFTLEKRQ